MASELRVDKIHNEGGDNDSGLDMSTNDVVAVRSDLPEDIKSKIYQILSDYMATDEGAAVMDEIYGWTDVVPADNSEFDVVKQAAEEFGLYDD